MDALGQMIGGPIVGAIGTGDFVARGVALIRNDFLTGVGVICKSKDQRPMTEDG